jgi:superfamily II DNA or RNA helicase
MHLPLPSRGSIVWLRQRRWKIESARRDHNLVRLDVVNRDQRLTFLTPFDRAAVVRPSSRPYRIHAREARARLAGLIASSFEARTPPTALDANVDILPYQLEPTLAVLDGVRRVLLADEVGLGKTIQAALAIAELKRRRPALRALVIVPRVLREQWQQELNNRFQLQAIVADRDGLERVAHEAGVARNPWTRSGIWIASADYIKQPHVLDAMPLAIWDIVVVDEAHDACGDSARHEASAELSRRARHVLLLTATPHVGDSVRFQRLVDFGRIPGLDDPLIAFRRTRRSCGHTHTRRVRWIRVRPSAPGRLVLDALSAFERTVLAANSARHQDASTLLLSTFRKRALSTMSALRVSLDRRLDWIAGQGADVVEWMQPGLRLEDPEDGRADDDCSALTADSGLEPALEKKWLRRLRALTDPALPRDSKIRYVVRVLGQTSHPVIVFTEFRHSLEALQHALARSRCSSRTVSVLHGGQGRSERLAALDRFSRGMTSVLLATDVASQGLNLQQRASWVVSLELPWTPARLEQRVGRVDRIGQTRPVHASVLVARHPAEDDLLLRLARRSLSAKEALGEDAFEGLAPPSERVVAHALLANASLVQEGPLHLRASQTWRGRAAIVARHLSWKRRLGVQWRTRDQGCTRPAYTLLNRSVQGRALVVVSVPFADATGFVIERRLVCVALAPGATGIPSIVHSDEFHGWLVRRLAARVRRLRARAIGRSSAGARVDEAIASYLTDAVWSAEAQPGLFGKGERGGGGSRREGWRESGDLLRESGTRRRDWDAESEVEIGRATIELIFAPRRANG